MDKFCLGNCLYDSLALSLSCPGLVRGHRACPAIPAFAKALQDPDGYVRRQAIAALRDLAPATPTTVTMLTAALQDSDKFVRTTAAETLGGLGPKAKSAVPTLICMLDAKDAKMCEAVADALNKIDPQAAAKAGVNRSPRR